MRNKFGVLLDRNGYAPSILQHNDTCLFCGRSTQLQRHEAFHGSNRTKSKALGCWALLCRDCHMKLHHEDAGLDLYLKRMMQTLTMEYYGWEIDDFRKEFGKNYLSVWEGK